MQVRTETKFTGWTKEDVCCLLRLSGIAIGNKGTRFCNQSLHKCANSHYSTFSTVEKVQEVLKVSQNNAFNIVHDFVVPKTLLPIESSNCCHTNMRNLWQFAEWIEAHPEYHPSMELILYIANPGVLENRVLIQDLVEEWTDARQASSILPAIHTINFWLQFIWVWGFLFYRTLGRLFYAVCLSFSVGRKLMEWMERLPRCVRKWIKRAIFGGWLCRRVVRRPDDKKAKDDIEDGDE